MGKAKKILRLLAITALGAAPLSAGAPPEVAEALSWIPQEELSEEGRGALAELPQGDRLAAEGMLRAADERPAEDPEACDVTLQSGAFEGSVDARAKLQLVDYAFLGHVVYEESGLSHGSPATLYTVAVERLLRWPADQAEPSTIQVLRYDATVRVDGHVLCAETPRSPARPRAGGGLLILTDEIVHARPTLVNALEGTLFFETSDGAASVPGAEDLDPLGWDRFCAEFLGTPPE